MNKSLIVAVAVIVIAIAGVGAWFAFTPRSPGTDGSGSSIQTDEAAVRQVVMDFGQALKFVPLSGPKDVAAEAIDRYYAPYLTSDVLAAWQNDPAQAVGRLVSSPWPDRIEINQVIRGNATRYAVRGDIIELTSADLAGESARRPIELTVDNVDGKWLISGAAAADSALLGRRKTFVQEGDFRIDYPIIFTAATGTEAGGGSFLGEPLVKISFPEASFESGTNFNEAYLTVSESSEGRMLSACDSFSDLTTVTTSASDRTVDGVTFSGRKTVGAAAGNRYDSEVYRTARDGTCYEIALTVHTGNAANYDPPVREFDIERAMFVLRNVMQTFRFE